MGNTGGETLSVTMFGKLRIMWGKQEIQLNCMNDSRYMQLFLLLLYHNDQGISKQELVEQLYGEKEGPADNALRIVIHRLRKLLSQTELPEEKYIVQNDLGYYCFSRNLNLVSDTGEFCALTEKLEEEVPKEDRISLLKQACSLYKGEFLEDFHGEVWIELVRNHFQRAYVKAAKELASFFKKSQAYEQLQEFTSQNITLFPYDEWQVIRIEGLIAQGKKEEAIGVYEETLKVLQDEFGLGLPGDLIQKFEDLESRLYDEPTPQSLIESVNKKSDSFDGAYYCNYLSFVDCCQVLKRMSQRNKTLLTILACNLTGLNGTKPEKDEAACQLLKKAIRLSLRKEDVYTKYGENTFMILMMGLNKDEDCLNVFFRIERAWKTLKEGKKLHLGYKVYPVNW